MNIAMTSLHSGELEGARKVPLDLDILGMCLMYLVELCLEMMRLD